MTHSEDIINLVDVSGNRIGGVEKLVAHTTGQLHESFSIFVFNDLHELLLQKRAIGKYHSGDLWSNTCCSHARIHEPLDVAAHKRLQYEMGFNCDLKKLFSLTYELPMLNGLKEHEFDYVFVGHSEATPHPNPEEVSDFKWMGIDAIKEDVTNHPSAYTEWFKLILCHPDFKVE